MPKEIRKGRLRISTDIPKKIHEDIRAIAFHHNLTMTAVIVRALVEHINTQKDYLKMYREKDN